ncbi:hypothetical protein ACFVFI_12595 [Streptomyces sp. NPDC057705]|uniref:hypothetical protein n=1 Tax=Streptomyces sp. NPDC057705 TaxID=3346222 RepID=UPI0036AB38B8
MAMERTGKPASLKTCRRTWGPELWHFIHAIKNRDWVVMPTGRKGTTYDFGRAMKPYRYDDSLLDTMAHARDVARTSEDIHAGRLGPDLIAAIHAKKSTVYLPPAQDALLAFAQALD